MNSSRFDDRSIDAYSAILGAVLGAELASAETVLIKDDTANNTESFIFFSGGNWFLVLK